MIAKSEEGDWVFNNQTTARVIELKLEDSDGKQSIWMDYHQWEQLVQLVKRINEDVPDDRVKELEEGIIKCIEMFSELGYESAAYGPEYIRDQLKSLL